MMTLEQIQTKLNNPQVNLSDVARHAKVTRSYISALKQGVALNPTYNLIVSISNYLESKNV